MSFQSNFYDSLHHSVQLISSFPNQSVLCVPLFDGDRVCVGVLQAINKVHGSFHQLDVDTMALCASLAPWFPFASIAASYGRGGPLGSNGSTAAAAAQVLLNTAQGSGGGGSTPSSSALSTELTEAHLRAHDMAMEREYQQALQAPMSPTTPKMGSTKGSRAPLFDIRAEVRILLSFPENSSCKSVHLDFHSNVLPLLH